MNPDVLNMEIRKFLKRVGVTSQREIEKAIEAALNDGKIEGNEKLNVAMTLQIEKLDITHVINDEIALDK